MAKLEVQYGEDKKIFPDGVAHLETEGNMMRSDLNLIATGGLILDGPYDSFEDLPEVGDPEHIYYVKKENVDDQVNFYDEYLYIESSEEQTYSKVAYDSLEDGEAEEAYEDGSWANCQTSEGWDFSDLGGGEEEL